MKSPLCYILSLIIIATISCESVRNEPVDPSDIPFVVEGWIEEGQSPVVMITKAADLTVDNPNFDDFVQKWCRVSIYDNEKQYILTARINHAYTPPLIFTNTRLRGQVGHEYRLVVEAEDRTITATALMTQAPVLDSLSVEPVAESDSLYSIRAFVNPGDCQYMKFFAKALPDDNRYYPTFLGTTSSADYNPSAGVSITRNKRSEYNDSTAAEFTHYYHPGDVVIVHACSVSPEIYDFWRIYDSNVSLSENIFFTFTENLPSNINGGIGYFAAYGSSEQVISIPR